MSRSAKRGTFTCMNFFNWSLQGTQKSAAAAFAIRSSFSVIVCPCSGAFAFKVNVEHYG